MIRFSKDVELERLKNIVKPKPSWELLRTKSIALALHKARELDWANKKVQVRVEQVAEDMVEYIIEPFEHDCTCPSILRYEDYFMHTDEQK